MALKEVNEMNEQEILTYFVMKSLENRRRREVKN
jgi:hypothetical protein